MPAEITENGFLDNRLVLRQPSKGFRAGSDAVLLAAAVPAENDQQVLDVGAGAGAIALCLAARITGLRVDGLELQPEMAALARQNVERNGFAGRIIIHDGDLATLPDALARREFDHVVTNPPYNRAGQARRPADGSRAASHMEGGLTLAQWTGECLKRVRRGGTLTLIHRMDRLEDIAPPGHTHGAIAVFPLWPRDGAPARQMIVQIRTGRAPDLKHSAGLVLHRADGKFTEAAEDVLRGRSVLALGSPAEKGQD